MLCGGVGAGVPESVTRCLGKDDSHVKFGDAPFVPARGCCIERGLLFLFLKDDELDLKNEDSVPLNDEEEDSADEEHETDEDETLNTDDELDV